MVWLVHKKTEQPHTFVRLQWGRSPGPPKDSHGVSVTHGFGADAFFMPETENPGPESGQFRSGIFDPLAWSI